MRIALISDIHGNLLSLEAVLADIHFTAPDQIIFLGDLTTLGPQPKEVVQRLQDLACPCVMGNHDTYLFDRAALIAYSNDDWFRETIDWTISQLSTADIAYIHRFLPLLEVPLDTHNKLLCFHGSPLSNTDMILSTTPRSELKKMLGGHKATIMAGGHTHVQLLRQHNGMLVINVGSVGMPFKKTPFKHTPLILPWAEYALVTCERGVLSVDLRRVPVDVATIRQMALNSTMPDRTDWVTNWKFPWVL